MNLISILRQKPSFSYIRYLISNYLNNPFFLILKLNDSRENFQKFELQEARLRYDTVNTILHSHENNLFHQCINR